MPTIKTLTRILSFSLEKVSTFDTDILIFCIQYSSGIHVDNDNDNDHHYYSIFLSSTNPDLTLDQVQIKCDSKQKRKCNLLAGVSVVLYFT